MPETVPDIARAAEAFRAQLLARDAAASHRMFDAYSGIYKRLEPRILAALNVAGEGTPEEQFERARIGDILHQVNRELQDAAFFSGELLTTNQLEFATKAREHAEILANMAAGSPPAGFSGPTWAHVPESQISELVGILGDGSPVGDILKEIAPDGVARIREAIIAGLGSGQTPGQILAGVREALGNNLARVMTVIRTEDMRAYRTSTHEFFKANDDIIKTWRWHASLSFDTCAGCLAKHGSIHPISEPLSAHPNCRCVALPVVEGAPDQEHETGDEWLKRQPVDVQRRALGPSKFDAWQSGKIELQDLAAYKENATWGGMHYEASLKQALENAAARRGGQSARTPTTPKPEPKPAPPSTPVVAPPAAAPPTPAPPSFETTKDAEVWLTAQGFKEVSFKGLNPEVAGEIARTLDEAKRAFPGLQLDGIQTKRSSSRGRPSYVMQNITTPNDRGPTTNVLEINLAYFKKGTSLADLEKDIAQVAESGWWVPNSVRGITFHEIGHTLTFQGVDFKEALLRHSALKGVKFAEEGLSKYSATEGAEGISETFAHFARYGHIKGVKIKSGSGLTAREFIKKYTGVDLPD